MTFSPIVERELNLASRRAGTYWARFWSAAVVGGITLAMMLGVRQSSVRMGQIMYSILTVIAFCYALLAGVRYTADCISEEKRQGTLGLLFLTELRGYDVVLGKLVVNSLDAVYGLLAILPILGLPLLLGGVTGTEFWLMTLVLLNSLFFSLSIGLLISTFGYNERQVVLGAVFSLFLLTLGLPVLWKATTSVLDWRVFDWLFLFPCPAYAFRMSDATLSKAGAADYWLSMATIFGVGIASIALSSILLPRIFQEKGKSIRAETGRGLLHQLRFRRRTPQKTRLWRPAKAESFKLLRTPVRDLLECDPFLWLLERDRLPKLYLAGLAVLMAAFGIFVYIVREQKKIAWMSIAIFGSFGLHLVFKFFVAAEASRRLNEDQRSGALELLLSTPMRIESILKTQFSSLMRLFAPMLLVLAGVNVGWMASFNDPEPRWVALGGIIVSVTDFCALSWVGMWLGLSGQRYARMVLETVGRVMIPLWTVLLFFIFTTMNGGTSQREVRSFFMVWFAAGMIYDLCLMFWAMRKLSFGFRPGRDLRGEKSENAGAFARAVV